MNIPNKREIILVIVGLAFMFSLGRYSVNTPPDTKLIETIKTDAKLQDNKNTHTQTKIVTTESPTGVKTTTTSIDTVIADEVVSTKDTDAHIHQTVTQARRSKVNVSLLVAQDLHALGIPSYGISVQKEFIGPITIGAFGLSSGVVGLSIGLNF